MFASDLHSCNALILLQFQMGPTGRRIDSLISDVLWRNQGMTVTIQLVSFFFSLFFTIRIAGAA